MLGQLLGLSVALVCLHGQVCNAADEPSQQDIQEALRIFQSLGETRKGLSAVKRIVDDIDEDLQDRQKRVSVCDISGGNAGYACYLRTLSSMDQAKSWLGSNPLSPGKRSARVNADNQNAGSRSSDKSEHTDSHHRAAHSQHISPAHALFQKLSAHAQPKQIRANGSQVIAQAQLPHNLSPDTLRSILRELANLSKKRRGLDILRRILSEMEADLILEQKRTCQFNLGGHCATESAASVADHWHYLNSAMSPGRKRRDTGLYKKLISGKLFKVDQ